MTRRGRMEGTIRRRPDGRWEGRYRVPGGKQHSVYGKSRREVQERLRAALIATESGIRPADGRLTTGAFLDDWLQNSVRSRLRPTTAESYRFVVDQYLKPEIGRVPLTKLAPEHVQRMLVRLASRGQDGNLSPTTVGYAHRVLRAALGRATKAGIVARNVAALVDSPPKASVEIRPLSAAEATAFLEAEAGDRWTPLWVAAIGLGLRQGELLGLRWEDVDQGRGEVRVRHTLSRVTGQLTEPKTSKARRLLRLPAVVSDALAEQRRRQLEERLAAGPRWESHDLVFASSTGGALYHRVVTKAFHGALERAGLPRRRFHDLRHTSATLGLAAGESLFEVSRRLGHANVSTTADIYGHVTSDMQQRSAARMDAVLAGREAV